MSVLTRKPEEDHMIKAVNKRRKARVGVTLAHRQRRIREKLNAKMSGEKPVTFLGVDYYTTTQAGAILSIDARTAVIWIHSGKLKASRPGRDYLIPEQAIAKLLLLIEE